VHGFSPRFTAPEVFARSHLSNQTQVSIDVDLEKMADVYAFGVIVYQAVSGKTPWEGLKVEEIELKVRAGQRLSLPEPTNPTDQVLKQLMVMCFHENPRQRPMMVDIHSKLETAFNL